MRALSADAALQHGLNPSATIIDELHAHRDDALYTALTTGRLAREPPFTLWITLG
jgi:phage terminase large subunit-like protein